LLLYNHIVTLV